MNAAVGVGPWPMARRLAAIRRNNTPLTRIDPADYQWSCFMSFVICSNFKTKIYEFFKTESFQFVHFLKINSFKFNGIQSYVTPFDSPWRDLRLRLWTFGDPKQRLLTVNSWNIECGRDRFRPSCPAFVIHLRIIFRSHGSAPKRLFIEHSKSYRIMSTFTKLSV